MGQYLKSCAFCGSNEKVTKDHVPPKNIFPKPPPRDLITVPACKKCNEGTSKDDEYFRLKLCMSERVGDHPSARRNREAILRSLKRPTAAGLTKSFLSDTRTVPVRTLGGFCLGRRLVFDVDLQRISQTVEKTVKGLYFHETGERFSSDYKIAFASDDTLRNEPPDFLEDLQQTILNPLVRKSRKVIANGDFSYRFHISEEYPFLSVWALTFYERVPFLCLMGSEKLVDKMGRDLDDAISQHQTSSP